MRNKALIKAQLRSDQIAAKRYGKPVKRVFLGPKGMRIYKVTSNGVFTTTNKLYF